MSRIGNKLISVPAGLNVTLTNDSVEIKGKTGDDVIKFDPNLIGVEFKDGIIKITRKNEEKHTKQIHVTTKIRL